ncbi:cytochrome P450 4A4-like [Protopterus annectens]|uniref:cytochrome P450 4A4-like n=1 Tax=Protopterus annectens TaxID=7888 RepID=UPI001CFC318B|nr:cytochrome P450 4A4-like [Protopterus annectens]
MATPNEQTANLSWFSRDPTRLLHLIVTFSLAYILFTVIRLFRRRRWTMDSFAKFPGPQLHWLYGNVHEYPEDERALNNLYKYSKEYPCACPFWTGPFNAFLLLTHPAYAKTILSSTEPKDDVAYKFIIPWIGDGLLVLSGQKWFRHRRLLTPGFHYEILKPYVKLVADSTNVMLDKLERLMQKGSSVDIYQHVSLMSLDSIMKCAFSYNSNCQVDRLMKPNCTTCRYKSFGVFSDLIGFA